MKETVKEKLDLISDIWNDFIWDYRLCYEQIKLENNERPPHFGSILGHFSDTFDIVYEPQNGGSYTAGFINDIGFLQTIFVHQDLVRELLEIFQLDFDLWSEENYRVNRNIRNELIGHPISRDLNNKKALVSSTLFSYHHEPESITYLRYHVDNKFAFETKSYNRNDIIKRHTDFLNKHFDRILIRLKEILEVLQEAVSDLEGRLELLNFENLLNESSKTYESIFKFQKVYRRESLEIIYSRQMEHIRYENLVSRFRNDLSISLKECERNIIRIYDPEKAESLDHSNPILELTNSKNKKYYSGLGKLGAREGSFDLESRILISECENNLDVVSEINHMRDNIENDIEYYCSYFLIRQILKV